MCNRYSSVILLLALATSPHLAASARVSPAKGVLNSDEAATQGYKAYDAEAPCWGCSTYPEAPDYADNWLTEVGLESSVAALTAAIEEGVELTDSEKNAALKLNWDMAVHAIINTMQGQACLDLCAVCMPSPVEMATAETAKLKTIHIQRSKNWQNASIWPVTGTVDTALGAFFGLVIPDTHVAALIGGGFTGVEAGAATGEFVASKTNNSFAGNILGAIAGISSGVVSGVATFAAIETLGLALGIWKGVGLTAAATDCKRVGFERFHGGENLDEGTMLEQPFTSKPWNPNYGLKRLRSWMKDNADWQQNTEQTEIHAGDPEAIKHCERVRDHNFDMRHASECLTHSQLCGSGGSLILPVPGDATCQAISNVKYLEEKAVQFGDDPEEGFFAQWRKMQEQIKEETGYDGKMAQCVSTLCKYDGFRKAGLKLHPDRINSMAHISADEKLILENTFKFLVSCKTDYKGADGDELTMNSAEERELICKHVPS